tara:strand:- start:44 stop:271 length:228 start_codon:yes stop_codon:yes gene_type:complete
MKEKITDWRKDYAENFCNDKHHLELLENGPQSLSQAWILGALHNQWKKIRGIKEPPVGKGYQTSLKEWFQRVDNR